MLLVALTPNPHVSPDHPEPSSLSIVVKLAGVVLASLSSGGGESSFLSLTHYYGHFSLASWSSGTGAAGLVGAGLYVVATTGLGWSVRGSLLACATLPLIMLAAFFVVLPLEPLRQGKDESGYKSVAAEDEEAEEHVDEGGEESQNRRLLAGSSASPTHQFAMPYTGAPTRTSWAHNIKTTLRRTRRLIIP